MSIKEVGSVVSTYQLLQLGRLYRALVRNRGMSIDDVAAVVDIALNELPDMKQMLEETTKAVARKQLELEALEEEEKRRRNRIITIDPSSYSYAENPASAPSSLPYWSSRNRDL